MDLKYMYYHYSVYHLSSEMLEFDVILLIFMYYLWILCDLYVVIGGV